VATKHTQAFTLRIRNPETYRMLKLAAEQRRVSMNDVVQEALEEHLRDEAAVLEDKLCRALEIIHGYTSADRERDFKAFVRAEVTLEDPVRSTRRATDDDRFGVRDAFVRTVE
jgi:hypothetical protein